MRRLAHGLVRDPNVALDVEQDAWVLALERPPRDARSGRPLRAWLASVTRTLARQSARGERRRAARERAVAEARARDGADAPAASEVVERGALQERVVHAVMQLDEPYRSTVLLRYLDGLDAVEIAKLQGIAPATVRKRLSRALAKLRERLDGELRDQGGLPCLAGLLSIPRRGAAGGAPALPLGLLLMSHSIPIAAGVGALALGVALFALRPSGTDDAVEPSPGGSSAASAVATWKPDDDGSARTAGSDPAPDPTSTSAAVETDAARWTVTARILDARGWPLGGATLAVDGRDDLRVDADSDGRVQLVLEAPLPLSPIDGGGDRFLVLRAEAQGCSDHEWFERPGEEQVLDLGEVRLVPIDKIVGHVVDPRGEPVANAWVHGSYPILNPSNREQMVLYGPLDRFVRRMTTSDETGYFEVDDMREGRWRIWAGAPGTLWTHSAVLALPSDDEIEPLELVLPDIPDDRNISGVVLDPEGEPLAGAMVMAADSDAEGDARFSWYAKTEPDGSFSFALRAGRVVHLRTFEWDTKYRAATLRDVPAGTSGLVLRLSAPRHVTVRGSDEDGRPLPQLYLRTRRTGEEFFRFFHPKKGEPKNVVRVLVPEGPFSIETDADDFIDDVLGPYDPETVPDEIEVTLRRPSQVRGRVTGAGAPISGARVQLVRLRPIGTLDFVYGFPARLNGRNLQGTMSDESGRFELPIYQDEEYVLFAEAEGWAAAEVGPVRLSPGVDDTVDVALSRGGGVEGRVIVPDGESAAGITVRLARGDMRLHRTRTRADGRYHIDGLTPGEWMVTAVRDREVEVPGSTLGEVRVIDVPEDYVMPSDCEVFEGELTRFDIDLVSHEVGSVTGRIAIDGDPAPQCEVRILSIDRTWSWNGLGSPQAHTGVDGRFELHGQRLGEAWALLTPATGPLAGARIVREIEIERGETHVPVDLSTAALELRIDGAVAGALALVTIAPGGTTVVVEIAPDAGGRAFLPRAAVGRADLVRAGPVSRADDPLSWDSLGGFEVLADQRNEAVVRAPTTGD